MSGSSKSELRRDFGIADTELPKDVSRWGVRRLVKPVGIKRKNLSGSSANWLRTAVHGYLAKMARGSLTLEEGGTVYHFGQQVGTHNGVVAHIVLENPSAYKTIAMNGVVGAAEAYMDGHWSSPDLLSVIRFFVSNIPALKEMDNQRNLPNRIALNLLDRVNRNSLSRAKENISAHYDLGNDFFELFLDPTMMYSAALFEDESMSLEEASIAKLDALCKKLELKPEDHLIEIGTGWGGMALHAVKNYGCKVTSTTLSAKQMEYTMKRVREEGLQDKIKVVMQDYRELEGSYDKLVSVEMIEAVGHEYFQSYFSKCSSLLKPDGLMALQAITIADQRYEAAKKSVDFIQRYIFPGGCLPSLSVIADNTARHTDMTITSISDLTYDYALTLKQWRTDFVANLDKVRAMGFDERFINMWMYYLCYCEGGFRERVIGVFQIVSAKPDYRPAS